MDVGAVKSDVIIEKPIHISMGGETVEYRCDNCDIAPQDQKRVWMPILEVCTQRRLCCAPSVCFRCTTSIL